MQVWFLTPLYSTAQPASPAQLIHTMQEFSQTQRSKNRKNKMTPLSFLKGKDLVLYPSTCSCSFKYSRLFIYKYIFIHVLLSVTSCCSSHSSWGSPSPEPPGVNRRSVKLSRQRRTLRTAVYKSSFTLGHEPSAELT